MYIVGITYIYVSSKENCFAFKDVLLDQLAKHSTVKLYDLRVKVLDAHQHFRCII